MFEDEEIEESPKKGKFGWIKNMGSALATAAKEHVATSILGDDWGEALVERMEEGPDSESESEDDDSKKEEGDEDKKEEKKKKRGGLFRRKKDA